MRFWCITLPWRQQTYVPNIDQRSQWRQQARTQACMHTRTHTYTHPEGKQDRKLSGEIRVNILFVLWDFGSKISLWRFKHIKSYPLKIQLIYSLLYSHQPLCLLFISALLMFIFIAISDTSVSVLFQSVSKVKFSPSKPSVFSQTPTHLPFLVSYSLYCSVLHPWTKAHACAHTDILDDYDGHNVRHNGS